MSDLPNISQEIETLNLLKEKLNYLNSLDIDYNSKEVKKHYQNIKKIETFIEYLEEIIKIYNNCKNLLEMKSDKELWEMAEIEYEEDLIKLNAKIYQLYKDVASSDEQISDEIIIEMRAGTGGDEASLFVSDMLKLYNKYCEDNGWKFEIVEISENDLKGIKSCSLSISGNNVLKYFQFEPGVHRVQRVPETEANGRIHTSTITLAILDCEETTEVKIDMDKLQIDTCRASGAGGQHVNKTDSAVRLTYEDIVIRCQDERSQIKNREKAMKILKIKVLERERAKNQQERNKVREQHIGTGERSEKSRTYNYPQNRVTDHMFNITLYQLDIVMAGNLGLLTNKIYEEYQKKKLSEKAKMTLIDSISTI